MEVFVKHKKEETFCGDKYLFITLGTDLLYVVIDGIGHGEDASNVANLAYQTIKQYSDQPIKSLIQTCEKAIEKTRGVAISFVLIKKAENKIFYFSVGNIESLIITPTSIHKLKTIPGIFGAQQYPIELQVLTLPKDAKLLMHTDGLKTINANIRQQFYHMNARHIIQVLSKLWHGNDDVCIICGELNDD